MEIVQLGRTELKVSRLCLGSWQVAGWQDSDPDRFREIIKKAVDLGINFIDTAEIYANGQSEAVIAKALGVERKNIVLASKVSHKNATPELVRKALEGSLKRLKTDYIDLYQYHWPAKGVPLNDTITEMEKLQKEGKIRYIGVSNWMEPEWQEFSNPERIFSLQPNYSLLWRSVEKEVLPLCVKNKIAVIPYSPLCQGILSGKFKNLEEVPPDVRKNNILLRAERFPAILKFLAELKDVANIYGKTMSQTALRWLMEQPGVTAPIIGVTKIAQLEENIGALGWSLSTQHKERLSEVSAAISKDIKPHDTIWGWHPKQ